MSAVWTHPSPVVTQFTIPSCHVELLRLVTSDDIVTSLLKRLSISIKIHVVKPLFSFQIVDQIRPQSSWGSCEYCVHTADATQLDVIVFIWQINRWTCKNGPDNGQLRLRISLRHTASTTSHCRHQHHQHTQHSNRSKWWWSVAIKYSCRPFHWSSPTCLTSSSLASRSGAAAVCVDWSPSYLQVTLQPTSYITPTYVRLNPIII